VNRPPLHPDFYYIILESYRLDVSIGIYESERAKPQPVAVTIAVVFPRRAQYQDRITEVIDYDFLKREIAALVHDRHINLLETLCGSILDICRRNGSKGAIVRSNKMNVYPDALSIGCEMSWFDDGVLFGA